MTARIEKLSYGLSPLVSPVDVAKRVIEGIYDGVTTTELDNLAAETAASFTTKHPDYALLASRIAVSNLHKNTEKSFYQTMNALFHYIDPKTGKRMPLLADDVWEVIEKMRNFWIAQSFMIGISDSITSDSKLWKNPICFVWMAKS